MSLAEFREFPVVLLWLGLVVACYTDLRTMRIPNWLTVGLMLFAVGVHTLRLQPLLPWVGMTAAFLVHYPLWLLKVERGGDAKLMMAIGAWLGWSEMLEATLWYAVLYLPIGLVVLAVTGNLMNLVRTIRHVLYTTLERLPAEARTTALAVFASLRVPVVPVEPGPPTLMKTAPIIAAGALAAWATEVLHLWV